MFLFKILNWSITSCSVITMPDSSTEEQDLENKVRYRLHVVWFSQLMILTSRYNWNIFKSGIKPYNPNPKPYGKLWNKRIIVSLSILPKQWPTQNHFQLYYFLVKYKFINIDLVYYRKASNLKGITPLVDRKLLKLFGPSRHFALDSKLAKW